MMGADHEPFPQRAGSWGFCSILTAGGVAGLKADPSLCEPRVKLAPFRRGCPWGALALCCALANGYEPGDAAASPRLPGARRPPGHRVVSAEGNPFLPVCVRARCPRPDGLPPIRKQAHRQGGKA